MNFKQIKTIFLLLSIASLTACESMISDVAVPESKPKLVISGYISTENDTLKVRIQKSRPLYSHSNGYEYGYPVVTDATVKISDGTNSISLLYNDIEKQYLAKSSTFMIEAGQTYHLEVQTADGEIATASCTTPVNAPPEIEITNIETYNDYGNSEKVISFRFKDLDGANDYYHVAAGMQFSNYYDGNYYGDIYFETGEPFVSDVNKEGGYFIFKTSRLYIQDSVPPDLQIFIAVTDENYYKYHRSIDNYQGDNPFSEPTPVFSNITGGVGVFGSYTGRIISINLK
jgi:hypothetical protein